MDANESREHFALSWSIKHRAEPTNPCGNKYIGATTATPQRRRYQVSMNIYFALKLVHILGAAVLFGTGLGIAFFLFMAHRSRNPAAIAQTARVVVVADVVFTATAVILQPLSGVAIAWRAGYSLTEPWIVLSLALYVLVGACWLPVVWIQTQLRDLSAVAARDHST